jgi:hypothetical protein
MPVQVLEYSRKKKRGRLHLWIVIAVVIIGVWLIGPRLPKLLIWTRWSCTHEWFDVTAGQIKVEDWAYFRKRGETIKDSPFTELYRELIGEPPDPDWRLMNTFSPGVRHSPHYIYHTVYVDVVYILRLFDHAEFKEEAKREIIQTVARMWPEEDHWSLTRDYLEAIDWLTTREGRGGDGRIEAEELPEAPLARP